MKSKQIKTVGIIVAFIGALGLGIFLRGGILNHIDVPTMIFLMGFSYFAILKYKDQAQSIIIGGSLLAMLFGFVAVLANLKDLTVLPNVIGVQLLAPVYALVFVFFIYNIYKVFEDETTLEVEDNKTINKKEILLQVVLFSTVILLMLLNGAGIGAYLDVPSIISLSGIYAIYFIEDKYKRMQVLKNYLIGFPYIIVLISLISILHNYNDLSIVGPSVAVALLSVIYATYLYLAIFKEQLNLYKQDTLKIEISLYSRATCKFNHSQVANF